MKNIKFRARFGFLLTLLVSITLVAHAQTPSKLALPSLSIFGLPPKEKTDDNDHPFSAQWLERYLNEIEKDDSVQNKSLTEAEIKRVSYPIIPLVFYRSRHLFNQKIWSESDIEEGQRISNFFARLVKQPDLEINTKDQKSFKQGLQKLRDWFGDSLQDNETLGAMIFTMDDGPFIGQKVDEKKFSTWKRLESAPIPGTTAKFVLMTDGKAPEPMIIGVMKADNSLLWARRYDTDYGDISDASLSKSDVSRIDGYGFKVAMAAGAEASRVYLDEKLGLRFYFVSW